MLSPVRTRRSQASADDERALVRSREPSRSPQTYSNRPEVSGGILVAIMHSHPDLWERMPLLHPGAFSVVHRKAVILLAVMGPHETILELCKIL